MSPGHTRGMILESLRPERISTSGAWSWRASAMESLSRHGTPLTSSRFTARLDFYRYNRANDSSAVFPKTLGLVVVDDTDSLEMGVDNRRTDKTESTFLEILGNSVRQRG